MITIFGGERPSYEEIGAMELLRSYGQKVRFLIPDDPQTNGEFYAARSLISKIGVDVDKVTPEAVSNAECLVCFGRETLFAAIENIGEKPKTVLYSPASTAPSFEEIRALTNGLFDKLFVKSPKYEVSFIRQLVSASNKGVEHIAGYVPYCSARSELSNLSFTKKTDTSDFGVLVDFTESKKDGLENFWRNMCGISCPPSRRKQVSVIAWDEKLTEQHGNPTDEQNKWYGELNAGLHFTQLNIEDIGRVYNSSSVLLNYHEGDETFSLSTARAFISGAVVVAGPNDACVDLIEHGKTGILVSSTEEALFQISRLAWEPYLRRKLASAAYNFVMTKGAANLDNCVQWWRGAVPWD